MEEITKSKKEVSIYKIVCARCGKEITGVSKKQLKHNFRLHEMFCKEKGGIKNDINTGKNRG